ncbi:MAG: HlyD family efflux transporter periplasmic adaptor subunit [Bifidobacteriaceae bacterium]|nr:HlyD family efflux transporter periplasmic adaptor subunit [Bifidobacteriaceae bacterium]
MKAEYIDLADVGTTREVLASEPPRGVRAIVLAVAAAVAVVAVLSGFLKIEETQSAVGAVTSDEPVRARTAVLSGTVERILARDGDTVGPGDAVVVLDTAHLEGRRSQITSEQRSNEESLDGYRRLREAANSHANPFDPGTEPVFHYELERYREELASAETAAENDYEASASTEAAARASLAASEASAAKLGGRAEELTRLAQAIRSGSVFSSADSYCQALHQSYKAGRPKPSADNADAVAAYDAEFVVQIETQIDATETQRAQYNTEVAALRAQLEATSSATATEPRSYVTAQFMLSISSAEQQLHQQQVDWSLEASSLDLEIAQATLAAPVAGVIDLTIDLREGDRVEAGQEVFQVVPQSGDGRTAAQVAMRAQMAANVAEGGEITCEMPEIPGFETGRARCWVDRIAAAARATDDGQAYYLVDLRLETRPAAQADGAAPAVLPGVPVNVTVTTRRITVLRWLGEKTGLVERQ